MDHLAIPVSDQERSRRFYETYFDFGARPARRYDDRVLMPHDAKEFALALGLAEERIFPPTRMHSASGCARATPPARGRLRRRGRMGV
jgi:catechol 2,3-dioxygenase-like lactoylglutathione lyase family enzyme